MIRWLFIRDNIGRLGGVRMKKVIISADDFGRPKLTTNYNITKKDLFQKDEVIELYVHPDYKNGVLIDNSVSYLGHQIVSLTKQIEALTSTENIELVSWADFNRSINKFKCFRMIH